MSLPKPPTPGASPTVRTAYNGWGSRRERPVTTAPQVNGHAPRVLDDMPPPQLTLVPDAPPQPKLKAKKAAPPVDPVLARITDEAVAAYNRILAKPNGRLSPVTALSIATRREQVAKSFDVAAEICRDRFGDPTVTPEFWTAYFEEVSYDEFRSGRAQYAGSHSNWKPDFEYLVRPATMIKVFESAVCRE